VQEKKSGPVMDPWNLGKCRARPRDASFRGLYRQENGCAIPNGGAVQLLQADCFHTVIREITASPSNYYVFYASTNLTTDHQCSMNGT
jgi:hypothetical protein